MQRAASPAARRHGRACGGTDRLAAPDGGLAAGHIGNGVPVENVDERIKRIVEHPVHAVPVLALAEGRVLLDGHVRHLGGAHDVADADLARRPRQLDAAVAATDRLDQACLLYTSPSPRDISGSRMPSSA